MADVPEYMRKQSGNLEYVRRYESTWRAGDDRSASGVLAALVSD